MKRKLISLIMVVCLMLTACSSSGNTADKQEGAGSKTESQTSGSASTEQTTPVPTEAPATPTPAPTEVPDTFEGKTLAFNLDKTYQTMDGFGAAFTWYAERLLRADDSDKGFDALFSDAKLNILRFKNEYEYNIEDKAENAVTFANYYKEARDRAAQYGEKIQVLMCCWSPPAKLKSDNSIDVGTGTLKKDTNGNYCYDEYAAWWVESLKYYMSWGIKIDYVSIQNEVDFAPEDYEGCLFAAKETDTKASYSKAFLAVYRAMKEAFGDEAPKLIGPETMSCDPALLKSYMKEALEEEPDSMYGYAFHLYQGGTSDSETMQVSPASYFSNFSSMPTVLKDVPKWQTEFYIGHGIQTSELILNALVTGNMTAYLYWSGVWADSASFTFESPDLLEIKNSGAWRTSANYWALRHFSEFIRPGYVRFEALSGNSKVKATGFMNSDKNKLAIVIVNPSDEEFEYRIKGNDYTVTDSTVYQSIFGDECEPAGDMYVHPSVFGDEAGSGDKLYQNLGSLGEGNTFTVPAKSVTTIDITGYFGDTEAPLDPVQVIVYDDEVITNPQAAPVPNEDKTIIDTTFTQNIDMNGFSGFGAATTTFIDGGGQDANGCMMVGNRAQDWQGLALSSGYFEHYGYMLYVSYDCMMENGGNSISCTSSFDLKGSTHYPDGENRRVVCNDMEAGKWYHVEGYMTMYENMDSGTFKIYWESAGNTDNFYLDNVKVQILYTMPAGEYTD